ncbi:MAG: hypothetical protein M1819_003939 [Sarea resinae]|nr:MAG: hypothetical protein M1819_003939 [Sarea resinae]
MSTDPQQPVRDKANYSSFEDIRASRTTPLFVSRHLSETVFTGQGTSQSPSPIRPKHRHSRSVSDDIASQNNNRGGPRTLKEAFEATADSPTEIQRPLGSTSPGEKKQAARPPRPVPTHPFRRAVPRRASESPGIMSEASNRRGRATVSGSPSSAASSPPRSLKESYQRILDEETLTAQETEALASGGDSSRPHTELNKRKSQIKRDQDVLNVMLGKKKPIVLGEHQDGTSRASTPEAAEENGGVELQRDNAAQERNDNLRAQEAGTLPIRGGSPKPNAHNKSNTAGKGQYQRDQDLLNVMLGKKPSRGLSGRRDSISRPSTAETIDENTELKLPGDGLDHELRGKGSLERIRELELQDDFTARSLQISLSPPVRGKNTTLDQIREREIESLKSAAITTNRLGEVRERTSQENLRSQSRNSERGQRPQSRNSVRGLIDEVNEDTEGKNSPRVGLQGPIEIKEKPESTAAYKDDDDGEPIPNTPIVVYRTPTPTSKEQKRNQSRQAQVSSTKDDDARPKHERHDSLDLLRQLSRAASTSPVPSSRMSDSMMKTARTDISSSLDDKALEDRHMNIMEQITKAGSVSNTAMPNRVQRRYTSEPSKPTTTPPAKTPIVTGGWLDTPLPPQEYSARLQYRPPSGKPAAPIATYDGPNRPKSALEALMRETKKPNRPRKSPADIVFIKKNNGRKANNRRISTSTTIPSSIDEKENDNRNISISTDVRTSGNEDDKLDEMNKNGLENEDRNEEMKEQKNGDKKEYKDNKSEDKKGSTDAAHAENNGEYDIENLTDSTLDSLESLIGATQNLESSFLSGEGENQDSSPIPSGESSPMTLYPTSPIEDSFVFSPEYSRLHNLDVYLTDEYNNSDNNDPSNEKEHNPVSGDVKNTNNDNNDMENEGAALEPSVQGTDRARALEIAAFERMNRRLDKLRLSIRDAKRGIEGLETRVSHSDSEKEDNDDVDAGPANNKANRLIDVVKEKRKMMKKEMKLDKEAARVCEHCGHAGGSNSINNNKKTYSSSSSSSSGPHQLLNPLYYHTPDVLGIRPTTLGYLTMIILLYGISEFTIWYLYAHPTYASTMDGYGVNIHAPRPPFATLNYLTSPVAHAWDLVDAAVSVVSAVGTFLVSALGIGGVDGGSGGGVGASAGTGANAGADAGVVDTALGFEVDEFV